MTRTTWILLAAGGSAALLGGAYVFQSLGYLPCQLCYWQRWPHMAAIAIGAVALVFGARALAWLGALAAAITSGIGIFHVGVEQHWWAGPASCTASGGDALGGDLLSTDGPRLILCDQVSWALAGISMPGWNALLSAVLVILWIRAARST